MADVIINPGVEQYQAARLRALSGGPEPAGHPSVRGNTIKGGLNGKHVIEFVRDGKLHILHATKGWRVKREAA